MRMERCPKSGIPRPLGITIQTVSGKGSAGPIEVDNGWKKCVGVTGARFRVDQRCKYFPVLAEQIDEEQFETMSFEDQSAV